jgi:hypothetical protein
MALGINRGFETMLPKEQVKEETLEYKNLITFRLFNRKFKILLEVSKE